MRPLFRWAGSKARLVHELERRMPARVARYHEPFCGSAALFFHAGEHRELAARLNDANPSLVRCMRALKQCAAADWPKLERKLERLALRHGPKTYREQARALQRLESASDLETAVRFLYVVGTNFNGLWRVNQSGRYNVPIGRKAFTFDAAQLERGARLLQQHAEITHAQWTEAVRDVRPGDFVYLDPPYFAAHSTYTCDGFGLRQHAQLAEWVHAAEAEVLVSLPDSWITRDLYRGLRIDKVSARRSIGAISSSRGVAGELLIRNY